MHKLHILAIAAHPDDVELGCAGTLMNHIAMGQKVGIVDLTQGELGTRGTAETRKQEAADAAAVIGVTIRMNAGMADGFFKNDEAHLRKLIPYIRHFQPEIVIANALSDRHPDHGRGGKLIADACFFAGLMKIETEWEGIPQLPWRPKRVFHMVQDRDITPTFIVDITATHKRKIESILCYKTQFYNPAGSDEPHTYIAGSSFINNIINRDALTGKKIGTDFAEGFVSENIPGIANLDQLILPVMP